MKKTKEQALADWKNGFWTFISLEYLKKVFLPMIFSFVFSVGFIALSFWFGNVTQIQQGQWLIPMISLILVTLSNVFIGIFVSKVYENRLDEKIESRGESNILLLNSLLKNIIRAELLFEEKINIKNIPKSEIDFIIKDLKTFEDNIAVIITSWKDVLPYSNLENAIAVLKNVRSETENAITEGEKRIANKKYEDLLKEYASHGIDSSIALSGDTREFKVMNFEDGNKNSRSNTRPYIPKTTGKANTKPKK